jgi:hypothetical protein
VSLVDSAAIFAKACFGYPSPSKRQKLNATSYCSNGLGRPASLTQYPTRAIGLVLAMSLRDFVKPAFSLRKQTLRENTCPIATEWLRNLHFATAPFPRFLSVRFVALFLNILWRAVLTP